ncbi:hypothetical protein RhiirA5_414940 [Rhizophagus irregularis]|uniref:Uncharacterized protein n=1 Tax=Rhizophagus irregularis TaxID=588596 RepID=A0A2N0PT25_9GLOM|nr:hypothetical protein RhiirA5_414940 [Rhizophagus irregularis]
MEYRNYAKDRISIGGNRSDKRRMQQNDDKDKDLLGAKHIYDLQIEMLCKNLNYQANGNEKLKIIFKIKMTQEQNKIWTSKCPGEISNTSKRKNNWILDALKILNSDIIIRR